MAKHTLSPGDIVLHAAPIASVRWCGERYYADTGFYKPQFTAGRHYNGGCAPFWVGTEYRMDGTGREWETENIYMVMDNFGDLVEVAR